MEFYSAIQKANPAICNGMVGPSGHYIKWKKVRKILYDLTHNICRIQTTEFIEMENGLVVARGRELRLWVKVVKRCKLPSIK